MWIIAMFTYSSDPRVYCWMSGRGLLFMKAFVFLFFFATTLIMFALLFPLPLTRNSNPGSHSRLFFPSPLRTVRALHFYREKTWALSSLVDSRRIVPTHARRSQQLTILFFVFLFWFAKKKKISPGWDSQHSRVTTRKPGRPMISCGWTAENLHLPVYADSASKSGVCHVSLIKFNHTAVLILRTRTSKYNSLGTIVINISTMMSYLLCQHSKSVF